VISKAVHHVSFSVPELEPALHFYRDILGFETIDRPAMGIEGAWLTAGSTQVHLIVTPDGADVGNPPGKTNPIANHTAFAIDDYEQVRDHLQQSGLEVLEFGAERGQMWVRDPGGNVLEFTTNNS
jgi:catechol 2,3-dioxygenase-like lactoylglutathione lyase family enzyme